MSVSQTLLAKCMHVVGIPSAFMRAQLARAGGGLGRSIGARPWIGLLAALVLAIAFVPGLLLIEQDSTGFELTTTTSWQNKLTIEQQAPSFVSKTDGANWLAVSSTNILQEDVLLQLFEVHSTIVNGVIAGASTFPDVCYRPSTESSCSQSTLFEAYNVTTASQVPIILANPGLLPSSLFGNVTTDANGVITGALSLIFTYTVDTDTADGEDWQKAFDSYFEANSSTIVAGSSGQVTSVTYITPVGAEEELTEIVFGEIPLILGSVLLILLYMAVSLFRFNAVKSRVLLGLCSIITVILAMACAIGTISYAGLQFSFIGVLTGFVLLGLGADNVMVMLDTLEHIDATLSIPEKLELLGARAGSAITITAMTSAVAFLVASSVHIPVIHTFCILSALAVGFEWAFKMTLYFAMICYDERRVQSSRADCLPCIRIKPRAAAPAPSGKSAVAAAAATTAAATPPTPISAQTHAPDPQVVVQADASNQATAVETEEAQNRPQKPKELGDWSGIAVIRVLLSRGLYSVMKRRIARVAILVGTLALIGACLYSATKLDSDANSVDIYPDGSSVRDFYDTVDTYYDTGRSDAEVVTFQLPYENAQVQSQLVAMQKDLLALPNVYTPARFWLPVFLSYQAQLNGGAAPAGQTAAQFCAGLRSFLQLQTWTPAASSNSSAATAVDVATLAGDVVLAPEGSPLPGGGCVTASRMWVSYGTAPQVSEATGDLEDFRNVTDTYAAVLTTTTATTATVEVPSYMREFTFTDTNGEMPITIIEDLAFGLIGVFAAMCVWMNPLLAAFVALMVLSIDVMLFGLLNVWGLKLTVGSFISQIIALGLAVDYIVYIAVAFVNSRGTALRRLYLAYDQMGVAVLSGGFSFFLGVCLLSLAKSSAFRDFFKVMLGTVVFGIAHGLLVAPALLTEAYAFSDWLEARRQRRQQAQPQAQPQKGLQLTQAPQA